MSDHVADLKSYIQDWAWDYRLSRQFGYFSKEDLKFDVNLDGLSYEIEAPTFTNQKRKPITTVLMSSNYVNETDDPQKVSISAKRTTSSTATARIKHGFTSDYAVGLKLQMPKAVEGKFDDAITVNAEEVQKINRTLTWTVDSEITAVPRQTTKTRYEVNEEELTSAFSTYVHLKGKVKVMVTDKRTKRKLTQITEDIKGILSEYLPEADENSPRRNLIYIERQSVRWPFRGAIDFRYGISQNVIQVVG